MANGHGGQRTPSHPAPVSGPGALSRRTDGGPATQPPMVADGGAYGSRKDMENLQGSAPMQGGGGGSTPPPAAPAPTPPPWNAPTQNPGEPVTAGAALGAGVGPQAAGIDDDSTATLKQMAPLVNSLELVGNLPGATPEFRSFVRNLKARVQAL